MNRLSETAFAVSGLRSFSDMTTARRGWFCASLSALLILGLIPFQASAATIINYGSFNGNTVIYDGVKEAANSAGDGPRCFTSRLSSAFRLRRRILPFPVFCATFRATRSTSIRSASVPAPTGGGVDLTDGNLRFIIKAKPQESIDNIQIFRARRLHDDRRRQCFDKCLRSGRGRAQYSGRGRTSASIRFHCRSRKRWRAIASTGDAGVGSALERLSFYSI